jgi:hypothetical protein
METPKDKAQDSSRVVGMREHMQKTSEPMSAPGPMHPAARAMQKRKEAKK